MDRHRNDARWLVVLALLGLLLLLPMLAMASMMGWGPWMHGWGAGSGGGLWGWWPLMVLGMLAFWGALIWGIAAALRSVGSGDDDGALRTLRERYARGEIDREEYETRRRTLSGERS